MNDLTIPTRQSAEGYGVLREQRSYLETRLTRDPRRDVVWSELTSYLHKHFGPWKTALDLGCGYGDFINHCPSDVRLAVDVLPIQDNLNAKVRFHQCDINRVDEVIEKASLDLVFSSNVLEHLTHEQIDSIFGKIYDLLVPGGLLILLLPNYRRAYRDFWNDYTHRTPLSDVAVADWVRHKGFEVEWLHPGFMPFSIKESSLPVRAWLVKAWLYSPWKPMGKQMLVVARKQR